MAIVPTVRLAIKSGKKLKELLKLIKESKKKKRIVEINKRSKANVEKALGYEIPYKNFKKRSQRCCIRKSKSGCTL
jgi:uncharacterized protein with ATP-grasp and redox domains